MNAKRIYKQVRNFVKFIKNGWSTELAFDVCYDMVYDLIDAEGFLNLCQKAVAREK